MRTTSIGHKKIRDAPGGTGEDVSHGRGSGQTACRMDGLPFNKESDPKEML